MELPGFRQRVTARVCSAHAWPRARPSRRGHFEGVVAPRREIQIKTTRNEIIAISIKTVRPRDVFHSHRAAGHVGKWDPYITLTLVARVVDHREPPFAVAARPGPRDEAIRGPVTLPRRHDFDRTPRALSKKPADAAPPIAFLRTLASFRRLAPRAPVPDAAKSVSCSPRTGLGERSVSRATET